MLIIALLMLFAVFVCFVIAGRTSYDDPDISVWFLIGFGFFMILSIIPLSMIGK